MPSIQKIELMRTTVASNK